MRTTSARHLRTATSRSHFLATAIASLALATVAVVGCQSSPEGAFEAPPRDPAATRPSDVTVRAADFDALWSACDEAARSLLFRPAVEDRRSGVYETEPMVSAQWFEPWRRELRTREALVQSSTATVRRTVTFHVSRGDDGSFVARPDVLVERYALSERRITTSASYRSVFHDRTSKAAPYGSAETDNGVQLPDNYWYPIGNDPALERYIAEKVTRTLADASRR